MTWTEALQSMPIGSTDDVVVAVSDALDVVTAAEVSERITERLDAAGVPAEQRMWIVANRGDDEAAARVAAAVSDAIGSARVIVHDPQEPDGLIFQRRIPVQRRGGIYLNATWQSASVRIACGDALELVQGLSAWFNADEQLEAGDLSATVVVG